VLADQLPALVAEHPVFRRVGIENDAVLIETLTPSSCCRAPANARDAPPPFPCARSSEKVPRFREYRGAVADYAHRFFPLLNGASNLTKRGVHMFEHNFALQGNHCTGQHNKVAYRLPPTQSKIPDGRVYSCSMKKELTTKSHEATRSNITKKQHEFRGLFVFFV
jgi:hypothetical protein